MTSTRRNWAPWIRTRTDSAMMGSSLPEQTPVIPAPNRQIKTKVTRMEKTKLIVMMIIGFGVPFLCWAMALVPHLPRSVYLYELGRLFGLMAFVLIFFQYILSSKIKSVERGIGLDTLFRVHKTCGILILILAIAHPASILISERLQGYGSPFGVPESNGSVDTPHPLRNCSFCRPLPTNPPFLRSVETHSTSQLSSSFPWDLSIVFSWAAVCRRRPLRIFWLILALV